MKLFLNLFILASFFSLVACGSKTPAEETKKPKVHVKEISIKGIDTHSQQESEQKDQGK